MSDLARPKPSVGYAAVLPDGTLSLHQLRKAQGEFVHEVVILTMEDYLGVLKGTPPTTYPTEETVAHDHVS